MEGFLILTTGAGGKAQVLDAKLTDGGEHLSDDHVALTERVVERDGHAVAQARGPDGGLQIGQKLGVAGNAVAHDALRHDRFLRRGRCISALIRADDVIADLFGQLAAKTVFDHSLTPPTLMPAAFALASVVRARSSIGLSTMPPSSTHTPV